MKNLPLKTSLMAIILTFSVFNSSAQLTDMGRLLTGGAEDGGKLLEAYLAPFPKAFGTSLNAGWYNTARPHRFPGFDLTFSLNVAFVPDEAKYFNLDDLQLSQAAQYAEGALAPTFSGSSGDPRPSISYTQSVNDQEIVLAEYTLPQGTGLGFIPAPALQLGVGVPLGTDIIFRYTPEVKLGDAGNMGLWGIGVKHSVKQWIPVLKRVPVFNLSVMGGYTKFYTGADINFLPEDIRDGNNRPAQDNTEMVSFDNQKIDFGVGSFTFNLVASADIPFFTAYAGFGINSTTTNLKMTGWYPVPTVNTQDPSIIEVTDESALKDPVDFTLGGDYKGAQPRVTVGGKFKLAVVHIHFDYTYAHYSVVSAGLGISFR